AAAVTPRPLPGAAAAAGAAAASAPTAVHGAALGPLATGRAIVAAGGPSALYTGLSAALTRQVTYTTMRLGLYSTFRAAVVGDGADAPPPSLAQKLGIGLAAGGTAAAACCPVEVAMVRMYADGSLPPAQRRNYAHVGSALTRMWAEEGVATLWRGAGPTVARACVVSAVQLGVYDQAKQSYAGWGAPDGVGLHLAASVTSGLAYSIVSLPIDIAKSKQQFQHRETIARVAREEGLRKLYAGFGAYFLRCGGHTVGMFLAYEQLNKLWGKAFEANDTFRAGGGTRFPLNRGPAGKKPSLPPAAAVVCSPPAVATRPPPAVALPRPAEPAASTHRPGCSAPPPPPAVV
ncbi:hypothetical protein BU14_0215s0013, partial [Porphyra umbilicalis]